MKGTHEFDSAKSRVAIGVMLKACLRIFFLFVFSVSACFHAIMCECVIMRHFCLCLCFYHCIHLSSYGKVSRYSVETVLIQNSKLIFHLFADFERLLI